MNVRKSLIFLVLISLFMVSIKLILNDYESSEFEDKTVIFFGDSVAYGYYTDGNGFGYYCDETAHFENHTNAAVNTATINTFTQGSNNVSEQLKKHKDESYDYVIIQGGYGDLRDVPTLGKVTEDYNINNLDMNTFAGGIEYTLYLAKTFYPESKIGFIISYDVPNSLSGIRSNYNKTKMYWDLVKKACDKWEIPYLNLFDGCFSINGEMLKFSDIFEVKTTKYLEEDYIHPNIEGYKKLSQYIINWMKEL